jgi:hypothetical protein
MRFAATSILIASTLAPAAALADAVSAVFGDGRDRGCFVREYDAAHLAAHPRQRVRRIAIDHRPRTELVADYGPVLAGISVTMRNPAEGSGGAELICRDENGAALCGLEADGGTVRLERAGDRLTVRVIEGLRFETETGFVDLSGGDDDAFVLRRAPPQACG